jgi:hypothetical protein
MSPPRNHLLPLRLQLGKNAGQWRNLNAVTFANAVTDCAIYNSQTLVSTYAHWMLPTYSLKIQQLQSGMNCHTNSLCSSSEMG